MELFDAKGNKYEGALTPEEVDTKIKEATDAASKGFEVEKTKLTAEATTAKAEAKKAADALAAADNKDINFAELRKKAEDAEARATAAEAARDEIVKKAVEGVTQTFSVKYRDDMLNKLSQGDQALKDKLLVNYETTLKGMPASTDKEIAERIEAAYRLSVDVPKPNLLNSIFNNRAGNGGGSGNNGGGTGAQVSPEVEAWGKEFGLTKEDIIKYTAKAKSNYNQSNDKS